MLTSLKRPGYTNKLHLSTSKLAGAECGEIENPESPFLFVHWMLPVSCMSGFRSDRAPVERGGAVGVYFHLMSDDVPPQQLKMHPPYVTGEEALKAAQGEAARTKRRVQIFRVFDEEVTSQPWRVVDPPVDGRV
jgi:hypothetical protein